MLSIYKRYVWRVSHFCLSLGGRRIFCTKGGDDDDIDIEEDVSKANKFSNEASKLSGGARILRDP